jgi:hypothetical protein
VKRLLFLLACISAPQGTAAFAKATRETTNRAAFTQRLQLAHVAETAALNAIQARRLFRTRVLAAKSRCPLKCAFEATGMRLACHSSPVLAAGPDRGRCRAKTTHRPRADSFDLRSSTSTARCEIMRLAVSSARVSLLTARPVPERYRVMNITIRLGCFCERLRFFPVISPSGARAHQAKFVHDDMPMVLILFIDQRPSCPRNVRFMTDDNAIDLPAVRASLRCHDVENRLQPDAVFAERP